MKHVTKYILVSYIYMKNVTKHVIKIYQTIHSLSVEIHGVTDKHNHTILVDR